MNGITWMLAVFLLLVDHTFGSEFKRVCYYGSWTNNLQSMDARFQISDIDPFLCTHVVFAFAKVNTNELRLEKQAKDDDNGQASPHAAGKFYEFTNLKKKNPQLKTLLSIGGETSSESLHKIAESNGRRATFAKNCLIFLRDRNFDGLDVDWEYPLEFRDDFTELLKAINTVFDKDADDTGRKKLILSIAGAAGKDNIDRSYNVTEIIKYVDFINIMAYDYFGPWSHVTGYTGPLYSRSADKNYNQQLSQDWTMRYWIKNGAPPEKLIMGTTASAVSFTLINKNIHVVGAPINKNGSIAGKLTKTPGHLAYYEVCRKGTQVWDDEQKMTYAYNGNEWYGFDNPRSMIEKVKYAKALGLGGVMFWIFDRDDFSGRYCGQGKFPLLNAIAKAAENRTFTRAPTTASTIAPTTQATTPKTQVTSTTSNTVHDKNSTGNSLTLSPHSSSNSSSNTTDSTPVKTIGETTVGDLSTVQTTTRRITQKPAFILYDTSKASTNEMSIISILIILFSLLVF